MKRIAIISGKGGSGKSSITASFLTLAKNTLAIDCDVDASNLYLIFNPSVDKKHVYISGKTAKINNNKCTSCGLCQSTCNFEAINIIDGKYVVDDISCEGCYLCSRVCPFGAIDMIDSGENYIYSGKYRFGNMIYGRLSPGEDNSGKMISELREKADQLAKENNIECEIIDGPPGIGCAVISTITGVDDIVVVSEPSLSGISDMKRAINVALKFTNNIYVIINKYDLDESNSEDIIKYCNSNNIKVIAKLKFDKNMVDAMINKSSIIEYSPNCQCSTEIKKAYNIIKSTLDK